MHTHTHSHRVHAHTLSHRVHAHTLTQSTCTHTSYYTRSSTLKSVVVDSHLWLSHIRNSVSEAATSLVEKWDASPFCYWETITSVHWKHDFMLILPRKMIKMFWKQTVSHVFVSKLCCGTFWIVWWTCHIASHFTELRGCVFQLCVFMCVGVNWSSELVRLSFSVWSLN